MNDQHTLEKRDARMIAISIRRQRRATGIAAMVCGLFAAMLAAQADESHDHGIRKSASTAHQPSQLEAGASLINGRNLFQERCSTCHGPRGQGTAEAAVDFSAPGALLRLTPETIGSALSGDHGGNIDEPLTEAEVEAIGSYVRNYLMLPAPDADTAEGRAIYARSCSVCHGDRGDAASWAKNSLNPAPANFTAHSLAEVSRAEMIDAVTFGKKDSAMMPFATQLSAEEIAATVDYIRTAFMSEAARTDAPGHDGKNGHDHDESVAGDHTAPFADGLTGDPEWGRAFFNANCAECHGEQGDGKGRRAYFMITKPENFLSREARMELNRPKLFEEISEGVVGTTMPAWEKVLTDQQIANVAEYVYRAFLHPDHFEIAPDGATATPAAAKPADAKKN